MTLVLDAGGLSALARDRSIAQRLWRQRLWPPVVPTVVITESLTGDHRRDFAVNRLLRACIITVLDETQAREAARLRTLTRKAGTISVVDAVVIALADTAPDPIVLTSDPKHLDALAAHAGRRIRVERV